MRLLEKCLQSRGAFSQLLSVRCAGQALLSGSLQSSVSRRVPRSGQVEAGQENKTGSVTGSFLIAPSCHLHGGWGRHENDYSSSWFPKTSVWFWAALS